MIKCKTSGLAMRKGARLGPKGGSLPGVKPAWICWTIPELMIFFLCPCIFFSTFDHFHVAVGMPVTRHPPHGSGLEALPHPALTLSANALNRRSGKGWTRRGLVIHISTYFRYSFHLRFRALWLLLLSTRSHSLTHLS